METRMAKELAVIEPLRLPDRHNPAVMPSLPEWLGRRIGALVNVTQTSRETGRYREVTALPAVMILNSSERKVVEQYVAALGTFLDLRQPIVIREKTLGNAQAIAVMIAGLLMQPGARLDGTGAESRTESYLDALDDLPAWTVREALRKWNRGESQTLDQEPHNFRWPPAPAILRRLAVIEQWTVKGRIAALTRLLDAETLIEYSEEYRAEMLAKLQGVVRRI